MICPKEPIVPLAMVFKLLFIGIQRFTSSSKKAPAVMTNQHKNSNTSAPVNPSAAVGIGTASMPAPIDVPTTSNMLPSNLKFIMRTCQKYERRKEGLVDYALENPLIHPTI